MTELEAAEHAAMLGELIAPLRNAGAETELVPATDAIELPTLVVALGEDAGPPFLNLNILPYDDNFAPLAIVQLFSELPFEIEPGNEGAAAEICAALLLETPVGGFAVDGTSVFYRYMHTIRQHANLDPEIIGSLIALIVEIFEQYLGPIHDVARGAVTVDQAMVAARSES